MYYYFDGSLHFPSPTAITNRASIKKRVKLWFFETKGEMDLRSEGGLIFATCENRG